MKLKNSEQNRNSIPIKLFKSNPTYFPPVSCDMINMSFMTGIFPDSLKNAVITPNHKKGQRTLPSNFRRISVLPFLSKIFEKCIKNKLFSFIYDKIIISNVQFGFVKNISTVNAVIELTEYVYESLNSKKHVKKVLIGF